MRIAVDARSLGPTETGPGIYARQLVDRIASLAPEWSFYLYWGRRESGTLVPDRENIIPRQLGLPGGRKAGNLVFEQLLLPRALSKDRCDLLWSPAFVLPIWKRTKQVVTMHDLIPLIFADQETPIRRLVYHRLLSVNARQADRILTVSESSADDLVHRLDIQRQKIEVIPNGLEDRFAPLREEEWPAVVSLLERWKIKRPYVLFTAGLLPRKNVHRLLEAFARGTDRVGPGRLSSLVLTGKSGLGRDSHYVEQLRSDARLRGIEDRVRFVGFRTREEVRLLYGGACCSVDPSAYEGFGFPVLESMACGCPVIASNRSSLPEVAGGAALLVDPDDVEQMCQAIVRLVNDRPLALDLRRRGCRRAREFSWDVSARRVLAVFQEVLCAQTPVRRRVA